MKNKIAFLLIAIIAVSCSNIQNNVKEYQPTFESLEKANPVPEWFKDAKFGIYFHWGVYSVPAYANEWYPRNMYISGSDENRHHIEVYGDPTDWPYNNFITGATDKQGKFVKFSPKLKSEGGNFDPEEWAQLFFDAGARYAGPVAEHHDGFSMWDSKVNPWNAYDVGPELDLVGLLAEAIRKHEMKVILSMHHAYNITGFFEAVPETNDTTLQKLYGQQGKEKNEAMWLEKHKEIINNYQPDIIWQDFNLHVISQQVLLEFLAYYYNKAIEWNKEVVATYKDGLNPRCAVLDFERGGAQNITPYYWLTDDAISSTSWCYTEGLKYYSKKQILHGFLDRISKNGNLLLNISPMADGSIPQGQKEILLSMGDWLKKFGESVYGTRAWEIYGEGPTKMGKGHGVFTAPAEGTAKDIRFTRSKDNTTLYAIMLGWDNDQKEVIINSLSSERMNIKSLKSISLIEDNGKYLSLTFEQNEEGLVVNLPEKTQNEPAYVLKLSFKGEIPSPDKFVNVNSDPYYHILPADNPGGGVLGSSLTITDKRKETANHWKLEAVGKGFYRILNRENLDKGITCSSVEPSEKGIAISDISGNDNELWKIEDTYNGYQLSNKQFPGYFLLIRDDCLEMGEKEISDIPFAWSINEVCESMQKPYKQNSVPGIIEAEDFDTGCPGDAYFEKDEVNSGGKYRPEEPVDIDTCSAGSYLIGWTSSGEWLAYTVNVDKSSGYNVEFYIAAPSDITKIHLECDGEDLTGILTVPNTGGYQNWEVIKKPVNLKAGEHVLKLVIDNGGLNLDKMVFKIDKQ
ncbi:MAG: alpha-L-fucosidase [Prolixibacteraceae bacterium]|nr:alpha-L-fucosidase [Prolixibacteraceae bacterium]